ncbi:hypothetical protein CTAYLR_003353 [Chrysophaeum taylorii]|uniref:PPC domain-containing protein n=1 Tax=Chrysophaeum taylorii TaxID=2483200 RepID=A0AAD7UEM6_9STRA|nr:hypothetical protein CTAYLR_003353 [Chrysophaeum taylorii]
MYALRLRPGEEIKESLDEFCGANRLKAAYVATCVGSVSSVTLRLANADLDRPNEIVTEERRFEIVSFVGTVSPDGAHLHGTFADAKGQCIGGHFLSATVFTTAEIVVGTVPDVSFRRVYDANTGFDELTVLRHKGRRRHRACAMVGTALVLLGTAVLVATRKPR